MNPLDSLSQRDESKREFISTTTQPNTCITMNYSKPTNAYVNYMYWVIIEYLKAHSFLRHVLF